LKKPSQKRAGGMGQGVGQVQIPLPQKKKKKKKSHCLHSTYKKKNVAKISRKQ
jgi:hypothetical protein